MKKNFLFAVIAAAVLSIGSASAQFNSTTGDMSVRNLTATGSGSFEGGLTIGNSSQINFSGWAGLTLNRRNPTVTDIKNEIVFKTNNNPRWSFGMGLDQNSGIDDFYLWHPTLKTVFYVNPMGSIGLGTTQIPSGYGLATAKNIFTPGITVEQSASINPVTFNKTGTGNKQELIFSHNGAVKWTLGTGYANNGTNDFYLWTPAGNGTVVLYAKDNGTVGIGTDWIPDGYGMSVTKGIITERLKVAKVTRWSDFVFDADYKLKPLADVEAFIDKNHHLPEVPSATEVMNNGIDVAEIDAKLLQKIEELTLYIIELNNTNQEQAAELLKLNNRLNSLEEKK
jgi:hypothetical protein